jgi:hypothetical protein
MGLWDDELAAGAGWSEGPAGSVLCRKLFFRNGYGQEEWACFFSSPALTMESEWGERSGRAGMGWSFEGLGRLIVVGRVVDDVWNGEWDIFHSHPAWATMGLFGWGLIGYEEAGKGYRGSLGCGGS